MELIRKQAMDSADTYHIQKPRVLFIGKRFYTNRDALAEAYGRIYQLPNEWAASGITTELWLVDYHSRESTRHKDGSLSIVSMPLLGLGMLIKILSNLFFKQSYTHVVASGDCYIGLLGYAVAKRSKSCFVFDVYDKYDDFSGYHRFLGLDLFPYLLEHAGRCLFASQALMKNLGRPQKKDLIVSNGLDTQRFQPLEMAHCRSELKLPASGVFVGYFGGMEPDRGVQDLVEAVIQLRCEGIGIELLIGGKLDPSVNLEIQGVRYVGNVPFDKMPLMLGACNLLAVPYRRSSLMDAGASNKIAEALACARPIAATETPNLVANFPETAKRLAGRLAEPSNPMALAQVIRDQINNPILGCLAPGWDWPSIALETAHELNLLSE